ncbi:DUF455 domain-containing protein [Balamuthia mandrillaris]
MLEMKRQGKPLALVGTHARRSVHPWGTILSVRSSVRAGMSVPPRSFAFSTQRAAAGSGTLCSYGRDVLTTSDPWKKTEQTQLAKQLWQSGQLSELGECEEIPTIARPEKPLLCDKTTMPSHKNSGVSLPIYLLHSLAHIELNAVDLGWDLILRFWRCDMPHEFYSDWLSIIADEARHFQMLSLRLQELGHSYGCIPAHDSLLKDGEATNHDLKARLAVVQLMHEARGLDSWDRLVQRFNSSNDHPSAGLVNTICEEEVDHVTKGLKWFRYLCERERVDAISTFHSIAKRSGIAVFTPFNEKARAEAGMEPEWYQPLPTLTRPPKLKLK